MELKRYERTCAPELTGLLEHDRYAFAVLGNILKGAFGEVSKIVTDHSRLILCYTCPPYPGWVWVPADADEAELARAWALIQRELSPEAGYRVNIRPELARYILSMAEGSALRVDMQLNAYGCETLASLDRAVEGELHAVGMEALDEAAAWLMAMKRETGLDPMPLRACREEMRGFIARRRLFMWKTPDGQSVAMCAVTENGDLGYLGHVYTPEEHRRRGYAAAIVHGITRVLLRQGKRPALCVVSTNAAAAACYERLGYVMKGSFCTIRK